MRVRIGAVAGCFIAAVLLVGCGDESEKSGDKTGQRSTPAPIAENAIFEITREGWPKTWKAWGEDGVARIEALQQAAAETAAHSQRCDRVEIVGLSDSRSSPPTRPVVYVDCANRERFYISESDMGDAVLSQSEKADRFSEGDAVSACTKALRRELAFPESLDRDFWSLSARRSKTLGNWVVRFDFSASNALGMDLPHTARCVMTPAGQTEVTIARR